MTAAEALVQDIESVGGVLTLVGDRIRYELPEDQAPLLIDLLCQLKPAVLEVLQRRAHRAADQEWQLSDELTQAEIEEINARHGRDLAPSTRCPACGGIEFWLRRYGGYVCANCHPNPRALPDPDPSIPAMPMGVKLVSWNPKPGPVAISYCAVVTNVPQFINYTLEQLRAAMDGQSRSWYARAWTVRDLVERLEECGVKVQVEVQKSEEGA